MHNSKNATGQDYLDASTTWYWLLQVLALDCLRLVLICENVTENGGQPLLRGLLAAFQPTPLPLAASDQPATFPMQVVPGLQKVACISLLDIYFPQKTATSAICN